MNYSVFFYYCRKGVDRMSLNLSNGAIGQVQGPFQANDSLNFSGKQVKLGVSIAEKDLMTYGGTADKGFMMKINDELIRLGREGRYESDDWIVLGQVSFPRGAPASVLVEYVVKTE